MSPRARPVLLALLGVLAIAVAAATLNSAVAVDGDGGFGSGDGIGIGQDGPDGSNGSTPGNFGGVGGGLSLPAYCVTFLSDPGFLLGAGALVLGVGYLLYRRSGPFVPLGLLMALSPPAILLYVFLTDCGTGGDGSPPPVPANESGMLPIGGGNGTGGGAAGGLSTPSLLLLVGLGVALLAAVALLFVTSDDQLLSESDEAEPEPEPSPAPEAIGRAAGRAADRIEEDADLENEVFRAWHEMTTYLDVPNPESSSPGEFADAAVDAGMDREDVSSLTRLFEEVRYGAAAATSERERRAVDALRRIEAGYAEDEP